MLYKVGDKIRIREDLVIDKQYGRETFVGSMIDFRGSVEIIDKINKSYYKLKGDAAGWEGWNWTDEMFDKKYNSRKKLKQRKLKTK